MALMDFTKKKIKATVEEPVKEAVIVDENPISAPVENIEQEPLKEEAVLQPQVQKQADTALTNATSTELAPRIDGWNNDVSKAPVNGDRVMLSETGKDCGVLAYWRVSRFVDKKNLRYVNKGRWTDFTTRQDVTFEPLYWKPYDAEEFWPLQSKKK